MRKVFLASILLALVASTTALAQVSANMELRLIREGTQLKAEARLSIVGQAAPTPVRDLKLRDNEIAFATTMLEAELRFVGKITNDAMTGTIEGLQAGAKVATGTWSLLRQKSTSPADQLTGVWVGTMSLDGTVQQPKPQEANREFNSRVSAPTYPKRHPKVLFDEAHNNTDTSNGRYQPFAELITSDGYTVIPNREKFSKPRLKDYEVLVIVNAAGSQEQRAASAFTEEECDAVRDWVSSGGALLLISDHLPYSAAASELSKRFDVVFTNGFTVDRFKYNKESEDQTELVFDRSDGLLGEHPITRGRYPSERINRVITFSGTSVKGPTGSVAFLKLADTALDILPPDRKQTSPEDAPPDHQEVSAAGRAQGVALELGKGRMVVISEAAALTAQVASRGFRFGMNVPGIDNRQLALNIMHWLSGALK